MLYRLAGNFWRTKYSWLLLALQVKVGKIASFVGTGPAGSTAVIGPPDQVHCSDRITGPGAMDLVRWSDHSSGPGPLDSNGPGPVVRSQQWNKIFVVRPSITKTTNILPHENYPLYGILYKHARTAIN